MSAMATTTTEIRAFISVELASSVAESEGAAREIQAAVSQVQAARQVLDERRTATLAQIASFDSQLTALESTVEEGRTSVLVRVEQLSLEARELSVRLREVSAELQLLVQQAVASFSGSMQQVTAEAVRISEQLVPAVASPLAMLVASDIPGVLTSSQSAFAESHVAASNASQEVQRAIQAVQEAAAPMGDLFVDAVASGSDALERALGQNVDDLIVMYGQKHSDFSDLVRVQESALTDINGTALQSISEHLEQVRNAVETIKPVVELASAARMI
jgi:hypothetical protein